MWKFCKVNIRTATPNMCYCTVAAHYLLCLKTFSSSVSFLKVVIFVGQQPGGWLVSRGNLPSQNFLTRTGWVWIYLVWRLFSFAPCLLKGQCQESLKPLNNVSNFTLLNRPHFALPRIYAYLQYSANNNLFKS